MKKFLIAGLLFFGLQMHAEEVYKKIEPELSELVAAQSFSSLAMNYSGTAGLKKYVQYTPSIEFVSRPKVKLAGLQFNPKNYTTISNAFTTKLVYFDLKKRTDREIKFKPNSIIRGTSWSPDDKKILISVEESDCLQLWLVQIPSLNQKRVQTRCLNNVTGSSFSWIDESRVLLHLRTQHQSRELKIESAVPKGPVIQVSDGTKAQNRTYQNLLKSPEDEVNFTKAAEVQLAVLNISNQQIWLFKPAIYSTVSVSPDKKYLLIGRVVKPYSYVVPLDYFTIQYEIWNMDGSLAYELHRSGPHEKVPIGGTIKGPRRLSWIPNEPHSLSYVEALDEGDWKNKVSHRDELFKMYLLPNGKTKKVSLYKTVNRYAGLMTLDRQMGFLMYDYERDTEWLKTIHLQFEQDRLTYEKTIFSLNQNDDYNNPGDPYTVPNEYRKSVVAIGLDGQSIYLDGQGATPEGYRPFLRSHNLKTGETKEIFRSKPGTTESFLTFTDDKKFDQFITNFETDKISPRKMLNRLVNGEIQQELLYADKNPFEIITKLKKEVLRYKRRDGVELSGTFYYPLNYEQGKKYPLIVDAYPLEYTDASTAGQVRNSAFTFEVPYRASTLYLALRGYAVLMDAQIPIIGHPETKNDTFLTQLKDGAEAAVKAAEKTGIVDSKKAGVIGHSYGAFMVANLLTHTDLFVTGVARSGAYNRTLTPFGFQGERRTFWEAKNTYLNVSPFYEAEKMKKPMLLIHGQADENSGTFTMQSERYFEALKGQGAVSRLVLLPAESHGYAARESVEHVLYETFNWFDLYLKK